MKFLHQLDVKGTGHPWQGVMHRTLFSFFAICLSVYIPYVAYFAHSGFLSSSMNTIIAVAIFVLLVPCCYFGLCVLCQHVALPTFLLSESKNGKSQMVFMATSTLLTMAILLIGLAACFPGAVSYDASNQWKQAQSLEFNNWHPVFHTLLIWICAQIVPSYTFVLLVQLLVFALAFAYWLTMLYEKGVPAWLLWLIQALIVASPAVNNPMMYVGKDNALTILMVLLFAQGTRIFFSEGKWLEKWQNGLALGLILAFATMVRHNGMFATIPFVGFVFFCYVKQRKQTVIAILTFALTLFLVQGALFSALDIVYPNNMADESTGIPMTLLCNAKQAEPELLSEEANAFLQTLASEEDWQTVYCYNHYNSIKFTFYRELLSKDSDILTIARMALDVAVENPKLAFDTFNDVTDLVWGVDGLGEGVESVTNSGDLPSVPKQNGRINALGRFLQGIVRSIYQLPPIRYFFDNIGVSLLFFFVITLMALYQKGTSSLHFAMGILVYHFGTMLLLASNDARFFIYSMVVVVPAMLALCVKRNA